MNKRFCKLGQYAAKAFFLFAVCGATYSCKDDYTLDDSDPSWLGSSIYEYLDSKGTYTNFVKLINDLDYKEVLARTGSKTLFVADDDAFATFYQSNPWGVRSYDQLTQSQKKLLLNSAMINNAYLLEMMSSTAAGDGDNAEVNKGQCLRRETSSDITDSIPHLFAEDLPVNYNAFIEGSTEKDYWGRFRKSDKGIYLSLDATSPMITHFLAAQMANKGITDEDFTILTGREREKTDAFIFDSRVVEQDITCQNGYINKLDRVLVPPQNMAEELRTNGQTNLFSHMMDRFSAPFYNSTLTARAKRLYGDDVIDSVFQKRYFSTRSQGCDELYNDYGTDLEANPTGTDVFDNDNNKPLPFDPGWNTYQSNDKMAKEQDMGVIFAPTDEKLMEYFFKEGGGGQFLIKAYAPEYASRITEQTTDLNLVYEALDQVPRDIIRALLNNLMKDSFTSCVPSKFISIKNSAQDAMFDSLYNYHAQKIDNVILANNGVIYIMDEVITPAEYAAVSAPALVEQDKHIFNWAINQERLNGVQVTYSAYLLAMQSRFSFFVPTDENFWYIDPVSFVNPKKEAGSNILKGYAYKYLWTDKGISADQYYYNYNPEDGTGTIGERVGSAPSTVLQNRLKDMLETHTIIHEDNRETTGINELETGAECDQHYFYTKNNAVVYVDNAASRKNGMTLQGGWNLSGNAAIEGVLGDNTIDHSTVIGFDDKSAQTNGYGNGFAYMIDEPIIPTLESVYSAMYNNPNFSKFFALTQTDASILERLGITGTDQNKYLIFTNNKGIPCYDRATGDVVSSATNVRFFNNYRYTIWVPDNEAMEEAEQRGLPTWEDVEELLATEEEGEELSEDLRVKATAMVTSIVNFVKYHFMDNCIFADVPPYSQTAYETATLNSETNMYCKLSVQSNGNGDIRLTDSNTSAASAKVTTDKNIIARDYILSDGSSATATITSSSSVVLHGIDRALDYKQYTGNRYDSDWATAAKARAYLKKYQLVE